MWRWLINGLGGLVGMMIGHGRQSSVTCPSCGFVISDRMSEDQKKQLDGYIKQLQDLRDHS